MASITFPLDDKTFALIKRFSWVNWSEVVREKLNKRRIFEDFIRTGDLSDEDQEFCDSIGWYPIDELHLKEEYAGKMKASSGKPAGKPMTLEEFNKWCDSL
ncbi:MAG: hypothetical protein JW724_06980 [Candidatus Altiarchaeota archaeon]|nr:hypothetical protein [Candidatus Altiarchaeota archaeon]